MPSESALDRAKEIVAAATPPPGTSFVIDGSTWLSGALEDAIAAAIEAAEARGREAERAEVVTWLRRPLSVLRELIVSDAIERGDHLGARDAE